MEPQFEWNIIFLIYADLTTSSIEFESTTVKYRLLSEKLRKLPVAKNCNLICIRNVILANNLVTRQIEYDKINCIKIDNGVENELIPPVLINNMNEKQYVIGDFMKFIGEKFPAKKTALFTWDHGSVFGINKKESSISKNSIQIMETDLFPEYDFYINPLLYRKVEAIDKDNNLQELIDYNREAPTLISRFLGEPLTGDTKKDLSPEVNMFTNEMLSRALSIAGFNAERKLEVLCMMNCCMNNLHTQYAVKDNVKYMVAPVTWIYFPGYDYDLIFEFLYKSPSINGDCFSKKIINIIRDDVLKTPSVVPNLHNLAIFRVEFDFRFDSIIAGVKSVLDFEYNEANNGYDYKRRIKPLISDNNYYEFEELNIPNYRLIDLSQFTFYRQNYFAPGYSPSISNICNKICSDFSIISKENYIGKFVKKIDNKNITGLSISLPNLETYHNPKEVFVQLFYKSGSKYISNLVLHLQLDRYLNLVYTA